MKKLMLFLFLFVTALSNAQCTQCGGSRVDVKFTTAIQTDTNGVDSTITGEFIFILDFKNSKIKYIKDGVLQWERITHVYGIFKENKHYMVAWNIEKNPGLDVIAESIIIDLQNNTVLFRHGRSFENPLTISSNSVSFVKYK